MDRSGGQPPIIRGEEQAKRGEWDELYDFGHQTNFFGKMLGIQIFFIFNLAFSFAA